MNAEMQLLRELDATIRSVTPMDEIVLLLRDYKAQDITQAQVYAYLDEMRQSAPDEATDDRILEVADFVAGFCSPHMRVWDQIGS